MEPYRAIIPELDADDEDLIADDTKELILWLKNPKNEAKVQLIEAQIEEYFK